MSDIDLDKYSEITDLNFEGDVHIAVTGRWQEFSANECITALMTKSQNKENVPQDIIKSLKGSVPEQVLVKMSYLNMRRSLQEALEKVLKESGQYEYVWVDVYDFNDDMVVFRFQDQLWAVEYEETEDDVITIGEDLRTTSARELYVDSETGEDLIKASFWKKDESPEVEENVSETDGEIEGEGQETDSQDTPDVKENEDDMSEKIELTPVQLQEEIQKALVADRKEQEEIRKAAEVKASTQELVKGFEFVAEDDQADLVKALIAEGGEVLVKALSAASEKIVGLQEELTKSSKEPEVKEEEESEEVVKESSEDVELDKAAQADARNKQLQQVVKAQLAKKK